ncbi:hypothetical protein ABG067_001143 [Albugo candida]|uniref:Rab-GAP TBC domain-containing protein n=1 Tax=Albugo candida TaxID=65357 RepID=A0A024FZL6_9STRA|nr:unnamed protein product [Albugo candida]|eukprot:CCI40039.1 unnamed protein product [Albugo candida]
MASELAARAHSPSKNGNKTVEIESSYQVDLELPVAFPTSPIDRYGFLMTDKRFSIGLENKSAVWLENSRTQKWIRMIGKQLEDWEVCRLKHASLLKKRIRKGIPEALRGRVWCHLAASTQMAMHNPGVYRELLQTIDIPCEDSIARDIGRTFPKHYLFHAKNSLGQGALMNVLKAYSLHDPDVGYCQGMAFLSAMFLSYIPEEQSFWHLVACLNHKRYDLANIYRPGMPKVGELVFVFERLMALYIPRVAVHLREEGLHPTTYLSQWFITLFTYSFPFNFVTRVWDIFLLEGWKIIYRVALALIKISQKQLLSIQFESIMEFFRDLPTTVQIEEVLAVAFSIPIKRHQLERIREEYEQTLKTKSK